MSAVEAREGLPVISEADHLRYRAEFVDDVLSKLSDALYEVASVEGWTKRDIATVAGMDETMLGRLLSGRRPNMKIETVAILARALRRRPELTLHDDRPAFDALTDDVRRSDALSHDGAWDYAEQNPVGEYQLAGAG